MKYQFILLILFLFPLCAFAGVGKAGNGGHIVICDRVLRTHRYELLDIYESRHRFNHHASLLPQTPQELRQSSDRFSADGIAEMRLREILPPSDKIFESLRKVEELANSAEYVDGFDVEVPQTGDAGRIWTSVSRRCEIRQLAAYRKIKGREIITIGSALAEALGTTNRTAFFLHEALHGYFGNQPTTLAVREVIWWLSAPETFRRKNAALILTVIKTRRPVDPAKFI